MSEIAEKILKVKAELPQGVTLVAVSKYHPNEDIMDAYNAGQRIFGENIVQELREKQQTLPSDIEWHYLGHLQTNKIKYIAPFISLIHAVDSLKLLTEINKQAEKNDRTIDCLLQIHIAQEETKFGFSKDEIKEFLSKELWSELNNVRICGLMCMASNTDNVEQVKLEFKQVKLLFDEFKQSYFRDKDYFHILSMGMSHDYPLAIQEGSTMVRVGTKIFGERVYN
ncbi:MAG: YggS family pyridoxal phosphate-dependent enzyme [Prevotellaceae bacterium]|nr:YggS family pyridoxal phosphate-dependent enzyme [Candidatus Faecinaster equi]